MHREPARPTARGGLRRATRFLAACGVLACADPSATPVDLGPNSATGGGGPPIKVTATDPTGAEQGTTLTVRVLGSNFEPGAVAEFRIDGVPPGKVRTNSTSFVSPSELWVDITIDADADLGLYDVEVTTNSGKKGVGTELFQVRSPGDPDPSAQSGKYELTNWDPAGKLWSQTPIDASLTGDGRLYFETGKGRNAREVCVDLTEPVVIFDQASFDLFAERVGDDPTSAGLGAACTGVHIHSRDLTYP